MCLDFDGHHSGGCSFDIYIYIYIYIYIDFVIRCGPYPQAPIQF